MPKSNIVLACYDDLLQELSVQVNALVGASEAKDLVVMADAKQRIDYLYSLARAYVQRSRKLSIN